MCYQQFNTMQSFLPLVYLIIIIFMVKYTKYIIIDGLKLVPRPNPRVWERDYHFTGSEGGAIVACMTGSIAASIVLVCESAPSEQVQTTTPPVGKFPGPCRYIVSS